MNKYDKELIRTAGTGNMNRVKILLDLGADINTATSGGWTPLHKALFSGHTELAAYLLQRGADAHARTAKGWSPLHQAAIRGYGDIARLLITRHGASPDDKTTDGRSTAYSLAMSSGHTELAFSFIPYMIRHH